MRLLFCGYISLLTRETGGPFPEYCTFSGKAPGVEHTKFDFGPGHFNRRCLFRHAFQSFFSCLVRKWGLTGHIDALLPSTCSYIPLGCFSRVSSVFF